MRPFAYQRASDIAEAVQAGGQTGQGQTDATAQFLAGGTTLVDLMKLDVLRPRDVVDISPLADLFGRIEADHERLKLGALVKMSDAANHPVVLRDYPVIAQSLQLAASAQLRNMATLGGNVLQRTRCAYFRDPSYAHCNKRAPGSGCSALEGVNRNFAVLGVDESCIAQYPGDFAVALAALDTEVELVGPAGARIIPFEDLHRLAEGKPQIETTLKPGEVITLYGIGFGQVSPAIPAGSIAATASSVTNPVNVQCGSTPATVQYAGVAPGFVGLYQFNVQVPNLPAGDWPLVISVNGTPVAQNLYITAGQ